MTTLYGISFVGHVMSECHIFLFKCFYDFFFFSLFFLFWLFSSVFFFFYIKTHTHTKTTTKILHPPIKKLETLQYNHYMYNFITQGQDPVLLIFTFIPYIYIVLSFDFLHTKPFAQRNKMFNVLCSSESCLILGLPFC